MPKKITAGQAHTDKMQRKDGVIYLDALTITEDENGAPVLEKKKYAVLHAFNERDAVNIMKRAGVDCYKVTGVIEGDAMLNLSTSLYTLLSVALNGAPEIADGYTLIADSITEEEARAIDLAYKTIHTNET